MEGPREGGIEVSGIPSVLSAFSHATKSVASFGRRADSIWARGGACPTSSPKTVMCRDSHPASHAMSLQLMVLGWCLAAQQSVQCSGVGYEV